MTLIQIRTPAQVCVTLGLSEPRLRSRFDSEVETRQRVGSFGLEDVSEPASGGWG